MEQRRVESWWAQWCCTGGTCAPPAAPPRNGWEQVLDTYTRLTSPFLRGCWAIPLAVAVFAASRGLGNAAGLWLAAAYFAIYGAYCMANFARCREAHCSITGPGWFALAITAAASAVIGADDLGALWVTFAALAVLGHGIEGIWRAAQGTNQLNRH
jgi:hypothetical protein